MNHLVGWRQGLPRPNGTRKWRMAATGTTRRVRKSGEDEKAESVRSDTGVREKVFAC